MCLKEPPAMKVGRLQHVQILRGLAALAVLFFHCMLNSRVYMGRRPAMSLLWQYGWLGVEFFFVLSGFIITYRHLDDLRTQGSVKRFLQKRFIRIYPLYWVVASVMLVYYTLVKKDFSGTTVTIRNWTDLFYLVKCYALFPLTSPRKNFIDVAWTLGYECLFYLVFALAIRLGIKKAVWLGGAWLMLILLRVYIPAASLPGWVTFILNPMIILFLSGSVVAYLVRTQKKSIPRSTVPVAFSVIAAIWLFYLLSAPLPLSEQRTDVNYTYLISITFAAILWIAVITERRSRTSSIARAMTLIGDASYSLYLSHPAAVMFCYKLSAQLLSRMNLAASIFATNLIFWLTVTVSIGAGLSLHLFVEKKILERMRAPARSLLLQ